MYIYILLEMSIVMSCKYDSNKYGSECSCNTPLKSKWSRERDKSDTCNYYEMIVVEISFLFVVMSVDRSVGLVFTVP